MVKNDSRVEDMVLSADEVVSVAHIKAMSYFSPNRECDCGGCLDLPSRPAINLTLEIKQLVSAGYTAVPLLNGYPKYAQECVAEIYTKLFLKRKKFRPSLP